MMLIVDDCVSTAEILHRMLARFGYATHVAYNGEQGVIFLNLFQYKAIFVDYHMPDMYGSDVMRFAKQKGVPKCVLFSSNKEFKDQTMLEEFDAVLKKPCGEQEVRDVLDKIGYSVDTVGSAGGGNPRLDSCLGVARE